MSHVHITNGLIIYDLTKLLASYPTQTAMVTEDRCCLETLCQIQVWRGRTRGRGGGAEGSPGITAELSDKRDIVTQTDPSKKTLLPVPSAPASSARAAHFPELKVPFCHHLLLTVHSSSLTICRHWHSNTVYYIWGGKVLN